MGCLGVLLVENHVGLLQMLEHQVLQSEWGEGMDSVTPGMSTMRRVSAAGPQDCEVSTIVELSVLRVKCGSCGAGPLNEAAAVCRHLRSGRASDNNFCCEHAHY